MKRLSWKVDIASSLGILILFQIMDNNLSLLHSESFHYHFLLMAKWLIVGGLLIHAIIDFLIHRSDSSDERD